MAFSILHINALTLPNHSILRCSYYSNFIEGETEAQKGSVTSSVANVTAFCSYFASASYVPGAMLVSAGHEAGLLPLQGGSHSWKKDKVMPRAKGPPWRADLDPGLQAPQLW